MQLVKTQQAAQFRPTDAATTAACTAFIERANAWAASFNQAKLGLQAFLRDNVKQEAKGIASRDSMLMGAFGVFFESNPGAGFIQAPRDIAESVQRQSLRGSVYFPDVTTAVGAQSVKLLNAISSVASERPLFNGVNGLKPLALDSGRLVLSGARWIDGAIVVLASKKAVSPTAALKLEDPAPAFRTREANEFLEKVSKASAHRMANGISIPRGPKA